MSSSYASDGCNFIVMSDAGKPVFARYGSEEEVSRICGLLQAIRTSIIYSPSLRLGDIQSLRSGCLCLVFMVVDSITLVAISAIGGKGESETEAYLRLQLEYIYSQIIFSFTEQVQSVFRQNASFDLRSMLGTTDAAMRAILNDMSGPDGDPAPFLTGGAQTLYPIAPDLRDRASKILQNRGGATENTVFAMLFVDDKVLTVVQPSFRPHQIRVSDLHLILHFVGRQPGILSSELWLPICLPRFNSSGFLYCYTTCLDTDAGLCLALISQIGTTEQFQTFRGTAISIRRDLGLRNVVGTVLKIHHTDTSFDNSRRTESDVHWSRTDEVGGDEDYVDASGDGDRMIPYVGGTTEDYSLLKGVKNALDPAQTDAVLKEYLDMAGALHFIFRFDVPIRGSGRNAKAKPVGHFVQCLSSPLGFPFIDADSRRRVWSMYQKLNLRLRLGSASVESMTDAFDMITQDHVSQGHVATPGSGRHCPAVGLVESPPNIQGLTYIIDNTETFLAMNGHEFELYVVMPSTVPANQGAAIGARLARRIMADQKRLFLFTPLTWKE